MCVIGQGMGTILLLIPASPKVNFNNPGFLNIIDVLMAIIEGKNGQSPGNEDFC